MFFGQIVNISEAVHEFSFVRGRDCVIHLLTHFSLPFWRILSFFDLLAFPFSDAFLPSKSMFPNPFTNVHL